MHPRLLAICGDVAALFGPRAQRALRLGLAASAVAIVSSCAGMPGGMSQGTSADMPEIDVAKDPTHSWGESQIAVNPKNPNNIVIATIGMGFTKDCQAHSPDCRIVTAVRGPHERFPEAAGVFNTPNFNVVSAMVSFDRGKTWKRVDVPIVPQDLVDLTTGATPYVTVTADGTFYFCFDVLDWNEPKQALPNGGVALTKSTDGGLTWSEPFLAGTPMDEPKLTSDLSTGSIYEASTGWMGPESTGQRVHVLLLPPIRYIVKWKEGSNLTALTPMDGEGMSMSAARGVLATAFEAPSGHPYRPNGILCGGAKSCLVFETTETGLPSNKNGHSWSPHIIPGAGNAVFSVKTQPMVAADPSKAGHFTVAVPLNSKEFDVYQTHDSGATWTGPVVLTEDNTKTHYHWQMAYSEDGVLGIMWRTAQPPAGESAIAAPPGGKWDDPDGLPDPGPTQPYNVWAAISRDGGATFSAPFKVSSSDSPAPPSGPMENAGDNYSSIAVSGDHVYVTWADWRPRERTLFFRDIALEQFQPQH